MNILELEGKSLAVVLWSKNEKGEDETFVAKSRIQRTDKNLTFEIFSNLYEQNAAKLEIVLDDEYIERLKPVSTELKEILEDADFSLSLLVGDLPQDDSKE